MIKEQWKNVPGKNNYKISNLGKVLNIKSRKVSYGGKNHYGYMQINLYENKKMDIRLVHRLVSEAFIPKKQGKYLINHKDGVKSNNYFDNLEWCSPKENVSHSYKMGLTNNRGENSSTAKLKEKDIIRIKKMYSSKRYSQYDLAEIFEVCQTHIGDIIRGRRWAHLAN